MCDSQESFRSKLGHEKAHRRVRRALPAMRPVTLASELQARLLLRASRSGSVAEVGWCFRGVFSIGIRSLDSQRSARITASPVNSLGRLLPRASESSCSRRNRRIPLGPGFGIFFDEEN